MSDEITIIPDPSMVERVRSDGGAIVPRSEFVWDGDTIRCHPDNVCFAIAMLRQNGMVAKVEAASDE